MSAPLSSNYPRSGRSQSPALANAERASKQDRAEVERLRVENANLIRLLLMAAAHCQGGHSDAGQEIASALCIPFPLRMSNLEIAAAGHGFDPDEVWPWLAATRGTE